MASLRQDLGRADSWELSPSSDTALRRAEAVRIATGSHEVTSEMLLYGLLGKSTGAAYCFLGAVVQGDPRVELAGRFGLPPRSDGVAGEPGKLTDNCRHIVETAEQIAQARAGDRDRMTRERHLFEAIFDVPESVAHAWLVDVFEPRVGLTVVREAVRSWPSSKDFTVAEVRQCLGLPEGDASTTAREATTARTDADADRVLVRHGDLLSDEECDLFVLPSSAAGTVSRWVSEIVANHRLAKPSEREFGTLGAVQRSGELSFVYAASVDAKSRSSPEAIRRIGQALARQSSFKRIGAPLLGAGVDERGNERVPARVAFEALRDGFLSVAGSRAQLVVLVPDPERFAELQARSSRRAEAAAASVISGFRSDAIGEHDLLDINDEVEALCSVIAAADVTPPLSIGLFGDWGSGKSFFIDKMKCRLDALATAARDAEQRGETPGYCSHIAQLEFNAWSYIDTDLWASLAEGIIGGLARRLESSRDTTVEQRAQRARLLAAAARSRDVLDQAEQRRQAASDKLASEEQRFRRLADQANAPIPSRAIVEREARELAVSKTAELRDALGDVARKLGTTAETSGARAALLDLQGTFRNVRAAWLCFRSLPGGQRALRLALPIVAFAVTTLVTVAIERGTTWMIEYGTAWIMKIGLTMLTAAGTAAPFLRRARSATTMISGLVTRYQTALEDERTAREKKLEDQRNSARAEVASAEQRVRDARADLAALEEQLDALRADRLMAEYIRKRHASDDYRKHFGVIARARDDFEQLSKLLVKAREEQRSEHRDLPRIDRIVLYIDDLDRCDEDQVVKVLQAVHLLLAFELFVVIVAVDSRWLLHSLQQHSKAFRSDDASMAGIPLEERVHWRSTPLNYLEKIFQIPFSLNPMDSHGFGRLIDSLVVTMDKGASTGAPASPERGDAGGARVERAPAPARVERPARSSADRPRQAPLRGDRSPGSPPSSTETRADPARAPIDVRPRHLEIGAQEQRFMKLLHGFVPSPRATKRFVNIYRLLRAGAPAPRLAAFTGNERTGEHQAALLLLALMIGYPTQAADLMHCLLDEKPCSDWWTWWDGFLASKRKVAAPAWGDVAEQLESLKVQLTGENLELPECGVFRFWAPRVARYSFESGRLGVVEPTPARDATLS